MKKRKNIGVERLKSRYGMMFVLPWTFGLLVFFVLPVIKSLIYVFSDTDMTADGLLTTFSGIRNLNYVIFEDPKYMDFLRSSIISFLYSFPLIVIVSLILAIMLAQNFRGRIIFRTLYFLPVIIAGGVVLELIFQTRSGGFVQSGIDSSVMEDMINVDDILRVLGLPSQIEGYFLSVMNRIMDLIWASGIQIILFIAGLQAIPDQMYEVAKVEGATKWEEFWFITFPMLSRVLVLVSAFTLIEQFTAKSDAVMKYAYNAMELQKYGESSAMLWIYFLAVGAIMAVLFTSFNRLAMKKWE